MHNIYVGSGEYIDINIKKGVSLRRILEILTHSEWSDLEDRVCSYTMFTLLHPDQELKDSIKSILKTKANLFSQELKDILAKGDCEIL